MFASLLIAAALTFCEQQSSNELCSGPPVQLVAITQEQEAYFVELG